LVTRIRVLALIASCSILGPAAGSSASLLSPKRLVSESQTAQVQSVSGHITSVAGNTFTLQTTSSQNSGQPGGSESITFTIDQDTVVEGRIEVGRKADVTYRRRDGNNIAVSVRVSPNS
jgi:hypothetical protein